MRVLVTRPQADAERTAERILARGHEAVVAPVLRVEWTSEPPPAGPFDAIILTSANAVPALASIRERAQLAQIFAVGERTACAAHAAGFTNIITAQGDARALANLVARTSRPGARLLHVAGRDRKAEPEASLALAGFHVSRWIAYEAAAAARLAAIAQHSVQEGRLDAALHYSRRTAEILLALVRDADLMTQFLAFPHVCLSGDIAVPLRTAGAEVLISARPDELALLSLLDEIAQKSAARARP
jgi:uroporphyrinogen-III synthase